MRVVSSCLVISLFGLVAIAQTPATVPPPLVTLRWDQTPQWSQVYGADYPAFVGQPYLREFQAVIVAKTGQKITGVIPRARVAAIVENGVATLETKDVPALAGAGTVRLYAVSQEGKVSEGSNEVPFTGAGPRPAVPGNFRLAPSP